MNLIHVIHLSNNHISFYENNKEYKSIIYKNKSCINELSLDIPLIDFKECYKNMQNYYKILEDLIIVILDKKNSNNNNPTTYFSFYNPKNGEKLEIDSICNNTVIIEEFLLSLIKNNNNYEIMKELLKQGINIFDLSNDFFTNICIKFNFPVNKDVALKDRIALFYPNVTLCDSGCEKVEIDFETMTSKCECKFKDIKSKGEIVEDNVVSEHYLS